jgi:hypothetical protein
MAFENKEQWQLNKMAFIPLVLYAPVTIHKMHNQSLTTLNSYNDFSIPVATPQQVLGSYPHSGRLTRPGIA